MNDPTSSVSVLGQYSVVANNGWYYPALALIIKFKIPARRAPAYWDKM
jgi:hypothetical protein